MNRSKTIVGGWAFALALVLILGGCDSGGSDGGGVGSTGEGGGFLWKPVGDHSRRLVVLLPPQYTARPVEAVYITTASGDFVEGGAHTSVANGNRRHYRFTKQGREYGGDVRVVAEIAEAPTVHWVIPNGAGRVEY
ncbi:MAG: hypothetical protein PHI93_03030 [Kiritimatiellae bacterium]|nr:hypothetical protein [Kiritimatiellia bacterium]